MHRTRVLPGARVGSEPVIIRPEAYVAAQTGSGWRIGSQDVPVHTDATLRAAQEEAHKKGVAEGVAKGKAAGLDEGRREGQIQGRQEAHMLLKADADAVEAVAQSIIAERTALMTTAGRDLVQLALTMAERISRTSIASDEEVVLRAIREALGAVGDARRIVVHMNPSEVESVRARVRELNSLLAEETHVELRADATISPGGCRVDTPELQLDATVEGLMERFEAALLGWSERRMLEAPRDEADDAA